MGILNTVGNGLAQFPVVLSVYRETKGITLKEMQRRIAATIYISRVPVSWTQPISAREARARMRHALPRLASVLR